MKYTFTCLHCGGIFPCNPRVKDQQYCKDGECRRASRRAWKHKNYATNTTYRDKCLHHQRAWRRRRPAHEYQRKYRESHPEYVERNRLLQCARNKKLRKETGSKIVNRNTLSLHPGNGGTYALMKVKDGKIVNRNTLMVRLQVLSGEGMIFAQNSV
jgi:hypothetical protein